MNILPKEKQLRILACLVDGNSERATERMTGANRGTISSFAVKMGEAAGRLHNRLIRNLTCSMILIDEAWSYCTKKQKRVTPDDPPEFGEAYSFTAIDHGSRLMISCVVGKRNDETTKLFVGDLRTRLTVMPTIISDGWQPYIEAIRESFGESAEYAQTVKNYKYKGGRNGGGDHRYEPPRDPFITKKTIFGAPDLDRASTAYVERNNGTMRHCIGRMRRLNYGFSKRILNHRSAWNLAMVHYNFCHVVKTLRVTPAMAAGVVPNVWSLEELYDRLIAETVSVAKPVAQPLVIPKPEGVTFRELPGGRGFLRVVPKNGPTQQPEPAQMETADVKDEPKEPS